MILFEKEIVGRYTQMQASPVLSLCPSSPSFNAFSSGRLAEIAARVVEEFKQQVIEGEDLNEVDDNFEFAFICREPETSPIISADEIFCNGQIRPIFYPVFNTNLLNYDQTPDGKNVIQSKPHRLPLAKLMSEERETTTSSSSSSEADELEGITQGTYCVWTPKKVKSGSNKGTYSSKRWKLRDLLYKRNKGEKRRSGNLAYREDLVGIFSNVNGLSRNLHPF